jgi:hypothetical protein
MCIGAGRPFAVFFGRSALLRRYSAADARRKLIVVHSATTLELSDASAQPVVEELLYSKSAVAHACPKPLQARSSRAETKGFSNGAAMAVGSKSRKSCLAGGVLSFSTRITLTARRQLSLVGESVAKAIGFRGLSAEFEVDEAVDSEDTKLFYVVL